MIEINSKFLFKKFLLLCKDIFGLFTLYILVFPNINVYDLTIFFLVTSIFFFTLHTISCVYIFNNFINNKNKIFTTYYDYHSWVENMLYYKYKVVTYNMFMLSNVFLIILELIDIEKFSNKSNEIKIVFYVLSIVTFTRIIVYFGLFLIILFFHVLYSYIIQDNQNRVLFELEPIIQEENITTIIHIKRNIINNNNECTICLDNNNDIEWIELQCNHKFHYDCIMPWIRNNRNCPNCRENVNIDVV